tara:strand:+ start:288 stop:521 length:234 start_codon:yes stop_codon:yes gene_type:complete
MILYVQLLRSFYESVSASSVFPEDGLTFGQWLIKHIAPCFDIEACDAPIWRVETLSSPFENPHGHVFLQTAKPRVAM